MKTLLITFFFLLFCVIATNYANANDGRSCKLSPYEVITIGCTKKCSSSYTSAIREAAHKLNYRVKILTLMRYKNSNYNLIFSKIDAIISPGGHDIDPKYYTEFLSRENSMKIKRRFRRYGKSSAYGRVRDAFEYELFDYYFRNNSYKNIPVLGICYGMQMLAAVKEIPLYVHIPADVGIPARRRIHERIILNQNSSLMPFIRSNSLTGYKNHHQAVDIKYFNYFKNKGKFTDISISGTSNYGKLAEVLELHNRPVIGLQFHPERSTRKTRLAVFSHFLNNACLKKWEDTKL
jgi:gamma-glutamyl-gamma-aminobutyrate hydrolase PuuD